jgi:hypothetical protein
LCPNIDHPIKRTKSGGLNLIAFIPQDPFPGRHDRRSLQHRRPPRRSSSNLRHRIRRRQQSQRYERLQVTPDGRTPTRYRQASPTRSLRVSGGGAQRDHLL